MKFFATIFLSLGFGFIANAQVFGPIQDFSEFLKEKRDDISSNELITLKDGSFQLITKENIYKLNNDLKFTGTLEKNTMAPMIYNNSMSLWLSHHDAERDLYVSFNGEDLLSVMKLNSSGANEIKVIKIPEILGVKSVNSYTSYAVKMMDDENLVIVYGAPITSETTHGKSKPAKDKLSGFVRVLRVNIKTEKVEDKFMFIDKVEGSSKEIKDVKYSIFDLEGDKVKVGVMKGSIIGAQYQPYTKIDAVYEIWELNLESGTEEKLTETKVKTPDNIRFCDMQLSSAVLMTYTVEIGKTNTFALFEESQTYEDGEWKSEKTAWPSDQIQISFPGMPIPTVSFSDENGNEVHGIQGNVAKSRKNKDGVSNLIFLDQNGQITYKEVPQDLVHFYFIYVDKNERVRHFLYEHDLSEETLKKMTAPLLKSNKMVNYIIKSNSLVSFTTSDEFIVVHSDWRATAGTPDYMVQKIVLTR